ncbi:MAG TPA: ATP-binding protein, partial [Saprospiraceae bacterium]|nr:ATP-binding protein [Saprospiraceae bacterium]
GRIQNWNSGAEVIKGYKSVEAIGKNFRIFYTPEDIRTGLPDRLLEEANEKGKATSEGWRVKKDGARFWANVVITALHNDKGDVIGYSKVTRDLTEKKAAEDALKKYAQDLQVKNIALENLNKELSSFAYVVSHDFKEPIRKIQTFAGRQLEEDKTIEQIQEFSNKIIASATRMQTLMDSLLSYSTISSQTSPFEKVDLNKILESVKSDLEVPINSRSACIEAEQLPIINGIPYQLHQMFLNLLSNSIKFTLENVKPVISIKSMLVADEDLPEEIVFREKPIYLITITDNGIGFEPKQSKKIFDVFQRLHPAEFSKGSGIGLSIVKKVVENHNGIIEAEGDPKTGATFRIYLPA